MKPKGLRNQIEYSDEFPIELKKQNDGQKVRCTFRVRSPCKSPFEVEKTYQITRIYPPFNLRGNNTENGIKIDDLELDNKVEITGKSQFSEEELKDPDCINCLNTLQVLK